MRMFSSRATRTILLASLGVVVSATADAGVRPKLRPTLGGTPEVLLVSAPRDVDTSISSPLISPPSPANRDITSAPPPARYFTINEVLARRTNASPATRLAAVDPSMTATDAPSALPAGRTTNEPFGYATFRAPEGLLWTKWRKVQSEIATDGVALHKCDGEPEACGSPAAKKFMTVVKAARTRDGRDQIDFVNRTVNADVKYTTDFVQHGVADLWSSPLATYASGRGDCEDYAIAKYVALREAGRSEDDLRLLLVHDNAVRMDHAVLAVRQDGRWLVLDNRHAVLMEQRDLRFFTPLFALDQTGVKFFAAPYANAEAKAPVAAPAKPTDAPVARGDDQDFSLRGTIADAVSAASSGGLYGMPLSI